MQGGLKMSYIQLNRSEKTKWLIANYPKVFLLLTIIAIRANRILDPISGFEIGYAQIGDWENCGLTRKEYRTALKILQDLFIVEILLTHKNIKNVEKRAIQGAIKRATTGTLVKLLNTDIYNINPEEEGQQKGHQSGHRGATDGPLMGHEEEENNTIKEKEPRKDFASTASPQSNQISLNENFYFENISQKDLLEWKVLYPSVDISLEILKMQEWCKCNISKAKSKKLWRKFITNWLRKGNEENINREIKKNFYTKSDNRNLKDSKGERITTYDNLF